MATVHSSIVILALISLIGGLWTEESNGACHGAFHKASSHRKRHRSLAENLKCGEYLRASQSLRSAEDPRMIGGAPPSPGWFPSIVRLSIDTMFYTDRGKWKPYNFDCTGVIIDNRHVITSAVCLETNKISADYSTERNVSVCDYGYVQRDRGTCMRVKSYYAHKDFKYEDFLTKGTRSVHNIGLLKLPKPLSYEIHPSGISVNRACLPPAGAKYENDLSHYFVGWGWSGKDEAHMRKTEFLQYGLIELDRDCPREFLSPGQSCFRTIKDNVIPCYGDFGSASMKLIRDDGDPEGTYRWEVSGIYSNTKGDSDECKPSQFALTKVEKYLDWIEQAKKILDIITE